MKVKKVKMILMMVCVFIMLTPIIQAVDNKTTKQTTPVGHWGRIIEAHCDSRYTPDANGTHGTVTQRYFVFGFGRHSIGINFEHDTYWQVGSWNNQTYGTGDRIGFFNPIARRTFSFHTSGMGGFIFGISKITLLVDGVVMDSDSCFYPTPYQ